MRILDVGQCGFDGPRMTRFFQERLGAAVDQANTPEDARSRLAEGNYDLVLINRIFAADGSSGLELIDDLLKSGCKVPLMLVSDLPDAQETAVARGAIRGFGKSELQHPKTLQMIKAAAGGTSKRGTH
jgi:two-component system chemotaxis response regulator CheY